MDAASGGRNTSEALQETAAPAPDPDNPFSELFVVLAPPSLFRRFSLYLSPPLSRRHDASLTLSSAAQSSQGFTPDSLGMGEENQPLQQEAEQLQPIHGRLQI